MKKIAFLLILLFPLSGCVIQNKSKTNANLQSWVGKPESQLITSWGAPTQTLDNGDSGKIIVYDKPARNIYGGVLQVSSYQFFVNKSGTIEKYLWKKK